MRQLPSLTALAVFEAVARRRSFKRAAAELGVTPTTVSHQIRVLEEAVGQALFRRRPRPIALTEAGASLYPALSEALDRVEAAVSAIRQRSAERPLRITTTNAFAHRWLVPRLPIWRNAHPETSLDVVGDDAVLDLQGDEADLAIRYSREAPADGASFELLRDTFFPVGTPALLEERPVRHPRDLERHTRIHLGWSPGPQAPTWDNWLAHARAAIPDLPALDLSGGMFFQEELHGIEAVIAGQGIAICSDVLVGPELEAGTLVRALDIPFPGLGFYPVYREGSPREPLIQAFLAWLRSVRTTPAAAKPTRTAK